MPQPESSYPAFERGYRRLAQQDLHHPRTLALDFPAFAFPMAVLMRRSFQG